MRTPTLRMQSNKKEKKNMKKIILSALALVALASCTKDETSTVVLSDTAATFTASTTTTRTTEVEDANGTITTEWAGDEQIGIFAYVTGTLATPIYNNVSYTTDASGDLTADTEVIYYPQTASVDFYAYYPYSTTAVSGTTYSSDITTQSDRSAIDLLYAKIEDQEKVKTAVAFEFAHALSRVQLNITLKTGSGISTMAGMVVELEGMSGTATFDLTTGAMLTPTAASGYIEMQTDESDLTEIVATGLFYPETTGDDAKIRLTIDADLEQDGNNDFFQAAFNGIDLSTAGKNYIFNVEVGYTQAEITGCTIEDWDSVEDTDKIDADIIPQN